MFVEFSPIGSRQTCRASDESALSPSAGVDPLARDVCFLPRAKVKKFALERADSLV
jgi:hypothetical protein